MEYEQTCLEAIYIFKIYTLEGVDGGDEAVG